MEWLQQKRLAIVRFGVFLLQRSGDRIDLGLRLVDGRCLREAADEQPVVPATQLGEGSFARIGRRVGTLAMPTMIVQEGGYNVTVAGTLVARFLEGISG